MVTSPDFFRHVSYPSTRSGDFAVKVLGQIRQHVFVNVFRFDLRQLGDLRRREFFKVCHKAISLSLVKRCADGGCVRTYLRASAADDFAIYKAPQVACVGRSVDSRDFGLEIRPLRFE